MAEMDANKDKKKLEMIRKKVKKAKGWIEGLKQESKRIVMHRWDWGEGF
jgi:preprotein translocase subunit SecE